MKRCRLKRSNFEIRNKMNKENEPLGKHENGNDFIADVSHSMTGDGMNCLEFFDMIKKEWCVSEEQYRPFLNDVLTFARKYHKERKEYYT